MHNCLLALASMAVAASSQPAEPSQADNGTLGAKLLITDDADAFWRAWEQPATPHINTTSKITASRPVHGMVLFYGCRAGSDGNCKVSIRFSITAPDGSDYGESQAGEAWNGLPAPGRNMLASLASIGFSLDPEDKFGRYQIKAVLTDNVAGTSVSVSDYVIAEPEPTLERELPTA